MTLSQTAIVTKQIITISIFAIVLGLISFIGYKIWYTYYLAHLPPVEEKPDAKFGLLPSLDFSQGTVSSSNYSYSIDTSTGNLPKVGQDPGFGKLVKVYFVTKTFASLLSSEKSQALAEKFDIKVDPEILSETSYRFKENDKTLTIDLDSGNFVFKREATLSAQASLDDDSKLISDFERNLENLGLFKEDLKKGRTKILFLKDAGKLTTTDLKTEAVATQISLWPSPIDNKPIQTPKFNSSLISATVYRSADNLNNYLSLNFTYYPIDTSTFATYSIKSAQQAFEDLKNGKGVITIEPLKPNVSITSVYLGYYLPEDYSPYLQPIFIFEGPHFASYVPALSEQFQTPAK